MYATHALTNFVELFYLIHDLEKPIGYQNWNNIITLRLFVFEVRVTILLFFLLLWQLKVWYIDFVFK